MAFLLAFEQHLLQLGKRVLDQHGANQAKQHGNKCHREIEAEHISHIVVVVNFLDEARVLHNHVVDEIGPERDLGNCVGYFGVHQPEEEVVLDAQQGGSGQQRHSDHEEQFGEGQVYGVNSLGPGVSQLKSPGNYDNKNKNAEAAQLSDVFKHPAVFQFLLIKREEPFHFLLLLLLLDVLHVEQPQQQPVQVGRAAGPGLDVDIGEVAVPLGEVSPMSHSDVLVCLHFDEVQNQRQHHENPDQVERHFSLGVVQKQDGDRDDKNLHVILQVPAPTHAHLFTIVDNIINKEDSFPHGLAIGDLTGRLELPPQGPGAGMDHQRVVDKHGHDVGGPEAQQPMQDSQWVLKH